MVIGSKIISRLLLALAGGCVVVEALTGLELCPIRMWALDASMHPINVQFSWYKNGCISSKSRCKCDH